MILIGIYVVLNIIIVVKVTFGKLRRKMQLKRVIKIKKERYRIMAMTIKI